MTPSREALRAAAVRALTGDAALHYRGGRLCRQLRPLPLYAPHLRCNAYEDDFVSQRGAADGTALRLLCSNSALHRRLCPVDPVERLLFELFEQVRCEAQVPPGMLGVAHNLRDRFDAWSRAYYSMGLTDGQLGILIYTVAQIVWSRVTGWPVLEETEDLIEATRAGIVPAIGVQLTGLRRHRRDQRAYAHDGWSFGEEDGRIDGRRLAQIVSSPAERRVFTRERLRSRSDCVVGFLIDCSGSMKVHIEPVVMLVDIFVRAGEQAELATEVLGFTTGAWNGGRARLDWLARGRPPHPGRLTETRHMVFKCADDSWRRARASIAALFKADLYREGVDGEAVEWACTRLSARPETRRILVVISDGSPMDAATAQANDAFYLDNHLKEVVARHETLRNVDVIGLGIGLDLSPYYRHCVALDLAEPLDMSRLVGLARWIGARR